MSNLSYSHCVIKNCKSTVFNAGAVGLTFHPFPTSLDMRDKWVRAGQNKLRMINWTRSKICSKHFEPECFESHRGSRRLKDNAVPTIYHSYAKVEKKLQKPSPTFTAPNTKFEKLLTQKTNTDLLNDINSSINNLLEPANLDNIINDNLKCDPAASSEDQLWLVIKKQQFLLNKVMQSFSQNKKHAEVLTKNLENVRATNKDLEQNVSSLRYIVKCLQEKHATLEEQIEILTAVESR